MTIALVGELRSQDHVGNWFDSVKVEYAALFPELPHRTRYYRVLKRLERIFADFALRFARSDTLHVIDSKPLPICKGVRWKRPRAMTEATSGRGGLGWFYGFKLHAVTNQQGVICRFAISQLTNMMSPSLKAYSPTPRHGSLVTKVMSALKSMPSPRTTSVILEFGHLLWASCVNLSSRSSLHLCARGTS